MRQRQTGVLWQEKATREGWADWLLTVADEPFRYFEVRPSRIMTAQGDWAKRYKHYE